jgi:hypothetical protein
VKVPWGGWRWAHGQTRLPGGGIHYAYTCKLQLRSALDFALLRDCAQVAERWTQTGEGIFYVARFPHRL